MDDLFISVPELAARIGTPDAPVIIDVCRPAAYQSHDRILPTSKWRNHLAVAEWAGELPPGADVVVNCVHGHNVSQLAVGALRQRGINARALAGGIVGWISGGGMTMKKDALPGRNEAKPSRWVTRIRPKIDRIACPWLITRFIDRDAEFYFVEPDYVTGVAGEMSAIAYDVPDVHFTHRAPGTCTFDALIEDFGFDDPALDHVRRIVRAADTADLTSVPEAAGLLAVSLGISVLSGGNDHAALASGYAVYDALYAWRRQASDETHNWPVTPR